MSISDRKLLVLSISDRTTLGTEHVHYDHGKYNTNMQLPYHSWRGTLPQDGVAHFVAVGYHPEMLG